MNDSIRAMPLRARAAAASQSSPSVSSKADIPIAGAQAMLADDVAEIILRVRYIEVAPAALFGSGLASELADASDRLALKVAKLTEYAS